MSHLSSEIVYTASKVVHPEYRYSQFSPLGSGQNQPLSTTGGQITQFELPPNTCYNLSKSYVEFTFTINAQGAGKTSWVSVNGFPFWRSLQLHPRGEIFLANIQNLHTYLNMTARQETKLEDMLTWDKTRNYDDAAGTYSGMFEGLSPTTGLFPTNLVNDTKGNVRPNNGKLASLNEAMYLINSTANNRLEFSVKLSLDKIHNTIFALNKNLLFNENLYIDIIWNQLNKIGFTSTDEDDPTTGRGELVDNPADLPTVSNLSLWLAVDTNFETQKLLREKIASGLKLLVPWVAQNSLSITSSTSQNPMLRMNGANGRTLQKIYWSPYVLGSFYDHNILRADSPVSLQSFNTYLDSTQLQQGIIRTNRADDYMRQKDRLRGSCIGSKSEYYYNYCYCEDFTSDKLLNSSEMDANTIDGIKLEGLERTFQINGIFNTSVNDKSVEHIFYYVTQKQLEITNGSIIIS